MRGAAVSFKGAASGVLVLLTATVVCGQAGWSVTYSLSQICAFEGSTVNLSCSYSYPNFMDVSQITVTSYFWFTREVNIKPQSYTADGKLITEPLDLKADSEFSGRVRYEKCENRVCHLIITNVRKSDSGVFRFRFITNHLTGRFTGQPGVTLTVTDPKLQVNVRRDIIHSHTWTELTCHSDCQLTGHVSYIWYNNRQKDWRETKTITLSSISPSDWYHCAIKGYEWFSSPVVSAPNVPNVSVSPSDEVIEGGSVTLTCSSHADPAARYTWYKEDGGLKPLSIKPDHVFSSIQSSDSGWYQCKADYLGRKTARIWIDVKYPPRSPSVSVSPSSPIEEGKAVTLSCSSDANPAADYTWYKDNNKLPNVLKADHHVFSVTSKDRGHYVCMSENHYGRRNSSSLFVDVLYSPKPPSVSVNTSGEVMEGHSVTLTCSSDANPPANYTWYKDNNKLPNVLKADHHVSSVTSEDRGHYVCMSENHYGRCNSSSLFVDVLYSPRHPSVSVNTSAEVMEGRSVTLTCSSDANPAATYTWYKQDNESPLSSGQNFTISTIKPEHSGLYFCKVQNKMGHNNSTIQLTVSEAYTKLWKSAIVGIIVFLMIVLLLIFLVMRKRRSSTPSTELGESPSVIKQHQPRKSEEQEEQDDLQYASVHFLNNQSDPVYMNVKSVDAQRPKQEEIDRTEYAAVNFANNQRTQVQESAEDSSALYSVINKRQ